MRVMTGKENQDGEYTMRVVGESKEGETPKEAIARVAELFLGKSLNEKKHEWNEKWSRLGKHESPTEFLPGLLVGSRLFEIATRWSGSEWVFAE